MSVHFSSKRSFIASVVAGGLLMMAPAMVANAGSGCGCEASCGCGVMAEPSCGCGEPACGFDGPTCGFEEPVCGFEEPTCGFDGGSGGCGCGKCGGGLNLPKIPRIHLPKINMKRTLVYKALDGVAGGIEKVFGLDQCHSGCGTPTCDDGCDAAMLGELVVPMPPQMHTYAEPMHMHSDSVYEGSVHHNSGHHGSSNVVQPHANTHGHAVESPQWQQTPPVVAPQTKMQMSQPRITPQASRPQVAPIPKSNAPMNRRAVPAPAIPEDKSLFDALSDPFSDDEVSVRRIQTVRPSSYEAPAPSVPRRALSSSDETSSRRTHR
ncbi:hypothetical protein K227x_18390 [Rubripirellula lacrimiformis]|uniref:Stigma-specific protein, Stig1 n=1 Tax=Rubripirellula lacrimiformis TaxID=1930273 RepID=A0A517N8I8_9BACT|nr:hypothetical protein [Rubripirellula lacrimiformis]QDT03455.1 hypothetical protein K227x_18390 [Rubripirellula lacrimiformis]